MLRAGLLVIIGPQGPRMTCSTPPRAPPAAAACRAISHHRATEASRTSLDLTFGSAFQKFFNYVESTGHGVGEEEEAQGVCLFRGLRVRMGLHTGASWGRSRAGGWCSWRRGGVAAGAGHATTDVLTTPLLPPLTPPLAPCVCMHVLRP